MSEHRYEIAVVIVNYRTPALVIQCVESLLPEVRELDARVVIVDNNSGDDSIEKIETWLEASETAARVELVRSHRNCGFSGGNNVGIRSLQARFYLLLNSDTLVEPGALRILIADMERFPQAGLVSPRLQWQDGTPQESCFRQHTPISELLAAARTGPLTALLQQYVVAQRVSDSMVEPEWTSFACVLIRAEVFATAGLLDEGFFMYYEDAEFCSRARRAGWSIVHDPAAHVVHLRGGTSPVKQHARERKRLPRYFYASRSRYFFLLYGWAGLTATNLLWWMGRSISVAREVFGAKAPHVCEGQWRDIWTNWLAPGRPFGCL